MSSYHSSFSYLGKNSKDDFGLIICHFSDNADSGEADTFLSTDSVYSDSYDGTRQKFYGSKYNTVAAPQITVIKQDGTEFDIDDNRKILKWLTGSKQSTWMDFYIADQIKYRLLGRVKSVSQYKMDARVIGFILTFESVSPYGYSSLQTVTQSLTGNETIAINCDTDDLYSYVYMNTTFENTTGDSLIITNNTIGESTEVTELVKNETITISDNMIIKSDKSAKTFGNTFNFVFPKLIAGNNEFVIKGIGNIKFEYITPVKLGDIAIDLNMVTDPICDSDGNIQVDTLSWERISDKPNTLGGYGITDAYTISSVYNKNEIDDKIETLSDEVKSSSSLASSLSSSLKNYYDKTQIDNKLDTISSNVKSNSSVISNLQSKLDNNYYTNTQINDNYYNKTQIDNIIANISYNPGTGEVKSISWAQITGKPTNLSEYKVKTEVQNMIDASIADIKVDINETELNDMLAKILV